MTVMGKRPRGRPKKRWLDRLKDDVRQHHPGGGSGPSQMETGVQNSGTCTHARYSLGQRRRSYIIVQFFVFYCYGNNITRLLR